MQSFKQLFEFLEEQPFSDAYDALVKIDESLNEMEFILRV